MIQSPSPGKDGNFAVLATDADAHRPRSTRSRARTCASSPSTTTSCSSELQLATTEDFQSKSKDGTEVHGLIVKPASYKAGTKYPTLLIVHGGPNGQDQHAFSFDREFLAANGYVVLAINYRGSAGRGNAYQKAILGDWGNLEVVDLLGAVDEAVRQGIADPNRLGIGGWSYGGISTDAAIATDTRFKAAVSGAGVRAATCRSTASINTSFSTTRSSASRGRTRTRGRRCRIGFFNADKIKTPTLFMGGEKDFNVPIAGGEQMYQALKSLGVDTQLVIYPGPVPRPDDPELRARSPAALPELVQQVPAADEHHHSV